MIVIFNFQNQGWGLGLWCHFQQYFSYIMAVNFIAGVSGENYQTVASHWQTLSNNVESSTPHHEVGFELTTLVVIGF
jgi:hypothetical protein